MKGFIKFWFSLTILSFSVYIPWYYLFANNAIDSVQELTFPTLVLRGTFGEQGRQLGISRAKALVKRYGIDPSLELEKALSDNDSITKYSIKYAEHLNDYPSSRVNDWSRIGVTPVSVNITTKNNIETRIIFATYQKHFTSPHSAVLTAQELFVNYKDNWYFVNKIPKDLLPGGFRTSRSYETPTDNVSDYLEAIYKPKTSAIAARSKFLKKLVVFTLEKRKEDNAWRERDDMN